MYEDFSSFDSRLSLVIFVQVQSVANIFYYREVNNDALLCFFFLSFCRNRTMNCCLGGVTSFPPSFIVNQLLDLMVSQRRDVIPKCDSHTNEELLFCETCDKIFCQLCDQHQISAEHTVVPFSLAIKRMNEILSFKASKSTKSSID